MMTTRHVVHVVVLIDFSFITEILHKVHHFLITCNMIVPQDTTPPNWVMLHSYSNVYHRVVLKISVDLSLY